MDDDFHTHVEQALKAVQKTQYQIEHLKMTNTKYALQTDIQHLRELYLTKCSQQDFCDLASRCETFVN